MIRVIILLTIILHALAAKGQVVDSAALDLKRLSDIDFVKRYCVYNDDHMSKEEIKITKLIWSLEHLRTVDKLLRAKGTPTVTMIVEKPEKENPYYVVGHYQIPVPDHMARMSFYRVDTLRKTIDYQDISDFIEDKWKRIR